jgi:arginine-tRNA-protein transferase
MRDGARKDPEGYSEWLVETCAPTVEVRYLLDSRLVAVSLLDLGRTSANSAYHYFDPQHAERSLGVYSVLKEIELCRALGMRWYYLGLWIAQSAPVRYKTEYLPHERLVRGVWRRFEEPVPKLELDPPARPPTARPGARTRAMRDGA